MMPKKSKRLKEEIPAEASIIPTENEDSSVLPVSADRVGNVLQKEESAFRSGLSRDKYIKVIIDLLSAGSVRRDWNKETGKWDETFIPDMDKRAKGAELAGKFFGDYKERPDVTAVTHNKVVYQWSLYPIKTTARHEVEE